MCEWAVAVIRRIALRMPRDKSPRDNLSRGKSLRISHFEVATFHTEVTSPYGSDSHRLQVPDDTAQQSTLAFAPGLFPRYAISIIAWAGLRFYRLRFHLKKSLEVTTRLLHFTLK